MSLTKLQLEEIIKEEIDRVRLEGHDSSHNMKDELKDLISDFDLDPGDEPEGFFLSLVRASGGKFLPPREQELAEEMRNAILNILLDANSNVYKAKF
jgi:hypothetical protein